MTYAGLTISDKPALLDAKAKGAEWIARDGHVDYLYAYKNKPFRDVLSLRWIDKYSRLLIRIKTVNLKWIKWSDAEPVNIDLALAQIAEMERIAGFEEMLTTGDETTKAALFPAYFATKANEQKPLTWNERINQMTVEEKAREFLFANAQDHVFKGTTLEGKFCYIALDGGYYETSEKAIAASEKFLRSPYTEGGRV